ncbi:MAG: aldehyde dehydrogenase family protein [Porphyromonadaceae bacterium]|nr:MAG: aldehyde dehydrogenase family protein [Porphyromonadaceae bacterium]
MEKYKIYAAGQFVDTPGTLEVRNPYDSQLLATTGLADSDLLGKVIVQAKKAEEKMKSLTAYQRSNILAKIAEGMMERKTLLSETLCQEAGKPVKYALAEVDRAIQVFKIASEETKRIPGEYLSIDWTPAGEGKEGWVKYFPVGLIGAISPFNFPLNLSVHKLAPAIATGNPIILKPASQTPVTVLELAKIIHECGLPEGAISILPMTHETGSLLITNPGIRMITFTGSPEVGWKIKEQSGRKKVVLELGGNAGVLVTETADFQLAVQKCVSGGFAYSGQVCIHVQRIFVVDNLFQEFVSCFIEAAARLKTGDPLDPSTDISSMIDESNACRVEKWIGEAVNQGAVVLLGGKRTGSFFQPTVITGTHSGMKVCDLEIFGPVVCIERVGSFSEGISRINESDYGLQAGIFTNRIDEMNLAFDKLEVGGVIINDVPTFRVDHMPYGGVKESGFGREGVKYAMLDMMEPRLLVKNK